MEYIDIFDENNNPKGFYPEQVYKKIGFKEICTEYYYTKKKV